MGLTAMDRALRVTFFTKAEALSVGLGLLQATREASAFDAVAEMRRAKMEADLESARRRLEGAE
jgi:hypothetical protein